MLESDIALMLRVKNVDDPQAFAEIMIRFRQPLHRFLRSMLADQQQVDDFAQETFLRLWLARKQYQPTGRFSTYLFQIAKHYCWNQQKRWKSERRADTGWMVLASTSPLQSPEAVLLRQERQQRALSLAQALPEHYRVVLIMAQVNRLSYAQIAEKLDIPLGTVKSRMAEGLKRIRETMAKEGFTAES